MLSDYDNALQQSPSLVLFKNYHMLYLTTHDMPTLLGNPKVSLGTLGPSDDACFSSSPRSCVKGAEVLS